MTECRIRHWGLGILWSLGPGHWSFTPHASFLVIAAIAVIGNAAEPRIQFQRDVRPILSDRCFACHGPDEEDRKADLRLDLAEAAHESAIVPGKPDESELVARIASSDPKYRMPPPKSGKSLSQAEIATLVRWVREGAEYQPHWAYVPPRRHPVPVLSGPLKDWPKTWIDKFIADRFERAGFRPSPDADPVTLVRRLSFDLVGLPPALDDVHSFQANPSDANYERLVDRLLASDRFGERMALYWLDLVRYADTVGYHGDQDHNISPYRDYVIDAFNDSLPFDQFTREQLAGDLVPNPTIDQRIATGYNRLLQTSHEGGVQPKEYLAIYFADRVRNLSAVWMGATVGCAQCHNHKYDPFTTKDFYALGAFFADIEEAGHFKVGSDAVPTKRPPEIPVLSKRERHRLREIERTIDSLKHQIGAEPHSPKDPRVVERDRLLEAKKALEARKRLTMVTQATEPRAIRILPRGNWLDDSGEVVAPQVPELFQELGLARGDFAVVTSASRRRLTRLDLANWLTDPIRGVGGLTARVQVNRLWYLFFGTGLARVLDDLGAQGEAPVHPELLDNLAVEFVESGWNVKKLIKTMVMSRAYRQSSAWTAPLAEKDPHNQLFARQSRYRLPAEMLRDQALAVSGLLVLDYGGPSVRPYQPAGYYRHLNFPKREYQPDKDSRQWRRGVYVHWQRQFLHPMLKAADAPSREECTAQRTQSNTPLAALALLNDPSFVEAARVLAERLLAQPIVSDDRRLTIVFQRTLSRKPDAFEHQTLQALLDDQRRAYAADRAAADKLTTVGVATRVAGVDPVELAAWTAVARAVLNLNETLTRR